MRYSLASFERRIRTFHHPLAGDLRFDHHQVAPAGHRDLRVIVHLALPDADSLERLRAVN